MSFDAFFLESGLPKTGLSPTIIIRKDSDGSVVVNGLAMTESGDGFYVYAYAAQDFTESYHYICDSVTLTGNERYAVGYEPSRPLAVAKGVALSNFEFLMVYEDHVTAWPGLSVSGFISQDGGAFASLTNGVFDVGRGVYKVNLTATEMNANVITLVFTASTADQRTITIKTTQP